MPRTKKTRTGQGSSASKGTFSRSDPSSWPNATVSQLHLLPAELLRLQLSARNLVTTGNKAIMAQRLHDSLHSQQQANSSSTVTNHSPTITTTASQSRAPTSTATMTVTAPSPTLTSSTLTSSTLTATNPLLNISTTTGANLQLATLLLQAATQLSANNQTETTQTRLLATNDESTQRRSTGNNSNPPPSSPPAPRADQLSDASSPARSRASPPRGPALTFGSNPPPAANLHIPPAPIAPPLLPPDPSLLPPVPARLRTRIIAGEYIDFNNLITFATLPGRDVQPFRSAQTEPLAFQMSTEGGELHLAPIPTSTRKITSFSLWMEAWNIYANTLLSEKPQRALELFGYQRIITSANLQLPLASWMSYDIKFRTLAASFPTLRRDSRISDLRMECVTMPRLSQDRWPCPHCNSTNHFPDRCPFRAGKLPAQLGGFPPSNGPTRNPQPPATTPALTPPQSNPRQPLIPTASTTAICRDFNNIGSCPRSTSCRYCHICEHCYGPHSRRFCPNLSGQSSNFN